MQDDHIAWFEELGIDDVPRVGGKNASLGEMVGTLRAKGVRVPDGFATTALAYRKFITANGIANDMAARISAMKNGTATLQQTGSAIRRLFLDSDFPPRISGAIFPSASEPVRQALLYAAAPPPRICLRRASRASRKPSSTSAASEHLSMPAAGALPHYSPTGR